MMVNHIYRQQPTEELPYISFQEYVLFKILSIRYDPAANIWNNRLNDDKNGTKCQADQSGVQDTKYCADGGVYYLNSWLVGKGSYVTGPKGWDKLNKTEYNLTAEVREIED